MNFDLEEEKMLSVELKTELKKFINALSQLETDVAIMGTGDANGAYWTGSNAYSFIRGCLAQIDHNHKLLSNLEKCSNYLETLNK